MKICKKEDKADTGNNYRGITLPSTVGKTFCKILTDRMGTLVETEKDTIEGQAGFRPNRRCVVHVCTVGKIIESSKNAGLTTYCFFLDVQKVYDCMEKLVVKKLWELRIGGKMGRMMKNDY